MAVQVGPYLVGPPEINENAKKSRAIQFKDWISGTAGAFRLPKAISQFFGWTAEAANLSGAPEARDRLKHVSGVFADAAHGLSLMRAAQLTIELPADLKKASERTTTENVLKAAHNFFDWIAAISYSLFPFTGNVRALQGGDLASLGGDAIDTAECASSIQRIRDVRQIGGVSNEINNLLDETEKHEFLKLCKAVTAVASGILGALALILGAPFVPAIVLLTISLASSILAITAHFKKEGMTHHLTLSDKDVQI